MATFTPLLDILADVPDPRRAEGKLYKLPHVLLFSILAIVSGSDSYRGIVTFIDTHRRTLNRSFGLKWRRAPSHTSIRYILQGLDPIGVEAVFRRHAALLHEANAKPGAASIALDGKTLRGSFDKFHDRTAAHVLSAFATDTKLVLAHLDIDAKSNEIPAAQALLAELGIAEDAIVTLDALHCQKNSSRSPRTPKSA
ncbi:MULTISPECIES: ISAs1 family transposase [Acidiphilium]|uniref:DDE_Tnp_1-associated n=1 Tax=Acidiphilium rubrum TaxID=526 RepID=A0A8G2CNG6_ACIRU|nr:MULTISPECIES: ISAs1 family transposase [Acidiphilium]SIR43486.1 DDE_Tnp_1-associated [Acidiphilium rubrum]